MDSAEKGRNDYKALTNITKYKILDSGSFTNTITFIL
jgi:hypothetical protein